MIAHLVRKTTALICFWIASTCSRPLAQRDLWHDDATIERSLTTTDSLMTSEQMTRVAWDGRHATHTAEADPRLSMHGATHEGQSGHETSGVAQTAHEPPTRVLVSTANLVARSKGVLKGGRERS